MTAPIQTIGWRASRHHVRECVPHPSYPARVVGIAFQNAAKVAALLSTTEAVVSEFSGKVPVDMRGGLTS
jgi:hypothetical protein